jgi:hypothetical protein
MLLDDQRLMVQNFIDKFDLYETGNQGEFKNDILMHDKCDDSKLL